MLTDCQKRLKKLYQVDKKVISARLNGKALSELSESELAYCLDKITLKCNLHYGLNLPVTDFIANCLAEEVKKLLSDFGYWDFSFAEIELAFEINLQNSMVMPSSLELQKVTPVNDSAFVDFLAKLLYNYSMVRKQLDERFKNVIDGHEER